MKTIAHDSHECYRGILCDFQQRKLAPFSLTIKSTVLFTVVWSLEPAAVHHRSVELRILYASNRPVYYMLYTSLRRAAQPQE
jgi:hypothetical protein